jgi:hypothetical protein
VFFTEEGFGVYGYEEFWHIGVAGGGVEFGYHGFGNLFSSDYWMGRLPNE